ncbi:SusD/RagB family nutrient-binding outer membrane lipoprotein [Flavobacterium sp. S87F.05.LMB.W.Kidney.N]|uniref:SusD/RagB family nutrient-binding outer membrane lipoprotein n=1 Tax=Flavobacterium sp. S87F.05.LMB.W.Kidney.N TaxID=1278758 RepID=UPI00106648A5|nr:SusD/RagB family nutrient-binding outer membrane lipoprotein [Flavobacterium sp. S87F.05.LMB.W.Kidney.N]TDX09362.1 SusD-like starch-binding protein associating with outer membrane [Flavobacterium sp. S87F.05.LMB.W.Kidney.N]
MKKYIKCVILATIGFGLFTSCQSELDHFNENPNSSISTTPSLLLSAMEVSTFSTHTTGLIRTSNILDQHLAGTSVGQLGDIQRYFISEQDVNNEWNTLYSTTLMNGYILNRDFATHYPYYNGIGQVLTAINLGYATDLWGDVPYDEAFKADQGNRAPKYNTQQEIYERLQSILDDAIVNLQKTESSNVTVPGDDDYIFNGNTKKWIQVAYVLKARYALRLTQVDSQAAQKALSYITASGISSIGDDANTFFPGTSNGLNQWYAFENSRANYLKTGAYFVNSLKESDDPRLSFAIAKDKNGNYTGNAADDLDTTSSSYIGPAFASATSSIGLVTYAEAKFIEAEAKFRLGQDAAQSLQDAVAASVLKVTGSSATTDFLSAATATVNLETIIQQKYLALFLTMEPYNDYRRTGFPVLEPNQSSNIKFIPLRLPTPSDERQYNPNATVVSNVTTNVWWDKN